MDRDNLTTYKIKIFSLFILSIPVKFIWFE